MNPPTHSPFPLSLGLLYELLDVDPELPPRYLLRRARQEGAVVSTLVLSLAEREGLALGEGARGELARMTRRSDLYRELEAAVRAVPGARTVKGPSWPATTRPVCSVRSATSTSSSPTRRRCGGCWPRCSTAGRRARP